QPVTAGRCGWLKRDREGHRDGDHQAAASNISPKALLSRCVLATSRAVTSGFATKKTSHSKKELATSSSTDLRSFVPLKPSHTPKIWSSHGPASLRTSSR